LGRLTIQPIGFQTSPHPSNPGQVQVSIALGAGGQVLAQNGIVVNVGLEVDNLTARLGGPDGGVVMISGHDDDFRAWMRERAPHFEEATGRSWPLLTHAITVIVDDVDAHFERAKRQGAAVLSAPKDQPWGVRSYAALDPEGHQWEFATVTKRAPGASVDVGVDDRA